MYTAHRYVRNNQFYVRYYDPNWDEVEKQIKQLKAWLAHPPQSDPALLMEKKAELEELKRRQETMVHYVPVRRRDIPDEIRIRPMYTPPAQKNIPEPDVCRQVRQDIQTRYGTGSTPEKEKDPKQ